MGSSELLRKRSEADTGLNEASAVSDELTANTDQRYFDKEQSRVTFNPDHLSASILSFVTCHHFVGSASNSSSPAHWHREIEVIHFISGTGFSHICHCKVVHFDAPAILVVPSNLIHRTCYPPQCEVKRILFSTEEMEVIKDAALSNSLTLLQNNALRGSILVRDNTDGFEDMVQVIAMMEKITNTGSTIYYDPARNQARLITTMFGLKKSLHDLAVHNCQGMSAHTATGYRSMSFKTGHFPPPPTNSQLNNLQERGDEVQPLNDLAMYYDESVYMKALNEMIENIRVTNQGAAPLDSAQSTRTGAKSSASGKNQNDSNGVINSTEFKSLGRALQAKASFIHLIGLLFEYGYVVKANANKRQRINRTNDVKIKELLTHIHDNYNRPLSVSYLSQTLDVTNQYFCRFFKQLTDMSFIDYLNDMRLQKAALDIATTRRSIREISSQHGFDSVGYFFKLFREHYHMTPVKYRKRFLEEFNAREDKDESEGGE